MAHQAEFAGQQGDKITCRVPLSPFLVLAALEFEEVKKLEFVSVWLLYDVTGTPLCGGHAR